MIEQVERNQKIVERHRQLQADGVDHPAERVAMEYGLSYRRVYTIIKNTTRKQAEYEQSKSKQAPTNPSGE